MELVDTAAHPLPVSSARRSPGFGKSAVSNGTRLHVVKPGDTAWARRFRDVFNQIVDDIKPKDGLLSEGQRQLARRAATLCITCEKLEGKAAADEDIDLEVYGKLTDRLGRAFQRLGLKRTSSNSGPSFGDLIRQDQAEQRRRLALEREQQHGG